MPTIEIRTRLDDGIYASEGGGETRTHYSAAAGPLNLLRLARKLGAHAAHMEVCYGNIGCGSSWIRIGDQRISLSDLPETLLDARTLLADVDSGAYAARLEAQAAEYETERLQYCAGVSAGRGGLACAAGAHYEFVRGHRDALRESREQQQLDRQHALHVAREAAADAAADAACAAQWAETQAREAAEYAVWRAATDVRQAAKRAERAARRAAA